MLTRLLTIVLCLLSFNIASAQSWKKDIESSIETLNKATISQDKDALEKLTADELSYGHSTGLVEDKTAFVKNILTGPVKFITIENTDQTITLAGDVAIVRNISSIKGNKGGDTLDLKIGVLMIWEKEGTAWKLLARQGFKL